MRAAVLILFAGACAAGAGSGGGDDAARPDARTPGPDAMRIDAMEPPPDARVVPDAMPADACVAGVEDVLVNGGLDQTPQFPTWNQYSIDGNYEPIVSSVEMPPDTSPQSPTYAFWFGGLYNTTTNATDYAYQLITIPSDATGLSVSGYLWVQSTEIISNTDLLHVEIRDPSDGAQHPIDVANQPPLETLGVQDGAAGSSATWVPFTLTPTNDYRGRDILLMIWSHTNGSRNTNFFVDSLSFTLEACP